MDISSAKVLKVIVHRVGNKIRDEGLNLSKIECQRSSTLDDLLLRNLLAPVVRNGQEYYLAHESDISLNIINHYAASVFSHREKFKESSEAIAKHLYSCSSHPNIGGGEFIVILFDDIRIDGHVLQALGFFRVETKDDYLDVGEEEGVIRVIERSGISLDKIQKGAIVLSGSLKVLVIDNLSQKTKYWIENFLKASPAQTPKKCAQVAGALLKAISNKVETPSNALEFARQVEDLLTERESLSLTDLRRISKNYIDDESIDKLLVGTRLRYGITLDTDLPIESKRLAKYTKEVVTKARIAEGVSLLVSNPDAKISSIDVKSTKSGFRVVVDIQVKGA
ncbi:nucleoid-associated protein [Alcaligenes sp. HNGD-HTN06]|uniref:nucleoid-associated protein n=1 Tax=Alcaligenes sp. HNGD-HTN06 TaxID=3416924 RepID=UPI003CE76AEF